MTWKKSPMNIRWYLNIFISVFIGIWSLHQALGAHLHMSYRICWMFLQSSFAAYSIRPLPASSSNAPLRRASPSCFQNFPSIVVTWRSLCHSFLLCNGWHFEKKAAHVFSHLLWSLWRTYHLAWPRFYLPWTAYEIQLRSLLFPFQFALSVI